MAFCVTISARDLIKIPKNLALGVSRCTAKKCPGNCI
jgi:hypothetical protein